MEEGIGRMIAGVVIFLVIIAVFIMAYAIISLPTEYIADTLSDSYDDIATENGWTDADEHKTLQGMNLYLLAGTVLIAIILFCVWLFAYAQKQEYEQYRGR